MNACEKGNIFIYIIFLCLINGCRSDNFLDGPAQGVLSAEVLSTEEGIDAVLIGAYSMLDGYSSDQLGPAWASSGTNWLYGDVMSDDSHLGSVAGACCGGGPQFERYEITPTNSWVYTRWSILFESIRRANSVLKLMKESDIGEQRKLDFEAEARFLRGHYYFEAKRLWENLPYFDEDERNFRLPNHGETALTWQHIIDDFEFASQHLPETQLQVGRATRYTALAYLGKVYLFEGNYGLGKEALDKVIQGGGFELLDDFRQNFDAAYDNNKEAVFQVQMSVNDGSQDGRNGNYGDLLNYPQRPGPVGCCGYHQPTQNLVNAYKVDEKGLPYLDNFNVEDVISDDGLASTDTFELYTGALDPRLDWTIGRRGIPYLDWGIHPGEDWIRDQRYGGPYSPKKRVFRKDQAGIFSTATGWTAGPNALNYSVIRYADVLLWRAEIAVEEQDLETARRLVNLVRERAMNTRVVTLEDGSPAANYRVGLYETFPSQEYARKATYFERRLELAMEGHRFFDLVRWGMAGDVLNEFVFQAVESRYVLRNVFFEKNKHEVLPIPQRAIDESVEKGAATLTQNEGY